MTQTDTKIKVYYDSSNCTFRTIRGISNDGYVVSEGTKFYSDSKTTIKEEIIEEKLFRNLIAVDCIDTFPYSEKINIGSENNPIIVYAATKEKLIDKMNLKELKSLLKISIESEDYETAAKIRNQINKISC